MLFRSSVGAGFALRKGSKWLFGSDFRIQEWEKYSYFGSSDSLGNSFRTSVGIQFVPNERALKSYWKTIQYRAGFHYEKSFLKINGEQLNEMGASIGVSLPIRRAGTSMHFSAEVGKRGTTNNGLIEERYLRFTLGFTINDHWFIKTKYD